MEQQTILKEILGALKVHSEEINSRIDGLETKVEDLESKMDKGFDRLGKKFDGLRVDITETQETTDFVLNKGAAQYEHKSFSIHR